MIKFLKGDLLQSDAQALVNTVNTVGVMGKGIALQFKNQYPHNYKIYKDACKKGELKVGEVLVVKDGDIMNEKYIINFPTKEHWRSPSQLSYIQEGLKALNKAIVENNITSIALPPLGCGNGGLDWNVVKPMIIDALGEVEIDVIVYEPNLQIKKTLQSEEKEKNASLTPSKAMLLYLMFHYESVGDMSSLFSANKLAYFLQESGEKLKLRFQAHHYGPYTVQLNHVLQSINGVYLKGLEQNEVKAFEPLILNYDKFQEIENYVHTKLKPEQLMRLQSVLRLIKGFESTYSLELLASVDFSSKQEGVKTVEDITAYINKWNQRKANLFKDEHINIAYNHLQEYQSALVF